MLLRIQCDDQSSDFPLGKKFGVDDIKEAPSLIQLAKTLQLNLIGICFHVGSGSKDSKVYYRGIKMAKSLFDYAKTFGFEFTILDIGGGFPGAKHSMHNFNDIATCINAGLEEFFPTSNSDVQIISEPGCFFVSSAFTLITNIHSKKQWMNSETGQTNFMYYLNVGVYGAFLWHLWDDLHFVPRLLKHQEKMATYPTTIWGPTCDATDKITNKINLPELEIDDFLVYENMGAYTVVLSTYFNGFSTPKIQYYVGKVHWYVNFLSV